MNTNWFEPNPQGGKLTMVVGLNWGSEAKGAVIGGILQETDEIFDFAVRVGSHNAGHTAYLGGQKIVVQTVPMAVAFYPALIAGVIGAGGSINLKVLRKEILEIWNRTDCPPTLFIDGAAILNVEAHAAREKKAKMKDAIGSTCKGVGEGRVDKIRRLPKAIVGGHPPADLIEELIADSNPIAFENIHISPIGGTAGMLNDSLRLGSNVMIEGTQGYLLSLSTSGYYPFCTSIECTPNALLADTGIVHTNAREIEVIGVTRTYPIRVHGNSGSMGEEVSWEHMSRITKGYVKEPEITTVTKLPRRIAKLDYGLLQKAVRLTSTTSLAVTFLDYLDPKIANKEKVSPKILKYLESLQTLTNTPVKYLGTGPASHFPYEEL